MIKLNQIYKCNICGNIVEIFHAGGGHPVCCGSPMELLEEKTQDVGMEKHVPIAEDENGKVKVKVGSIPHPMEEAHFIEWIEVIAGSRVYRKHLQPNDEPESVFCKSVSGDVILRAYCNVHGLWSNKK